MHIGEIKSRNNVEIYLLIIKLLKRLVKTCEKLFSKILNPFILL